MQIGEALLNVFTDGLTSRLSMRLDNAPSSLLVGAHPFKDRMEGHCTTQAESLT